MTAITIRNLDDQVKHRLQLRAAKNGRSMESEAREILSQAVTNSDTPTTLVDAIRQRFSELGGVELDLPTRDARPRAPEFR